MTREGKKLANYYDNKIILITGVTGFIGKVCLVKLLSSFPNCGKVYVMLRSKKGMTPQQRFNQFINQEPFKSFKNKSSNNNGYGGQNGTAAIDNPNESCEIDWSKVIAVDGDMSSENLGFNDENEKLLCSTVNIIFNIAASVQFDAPLKQNLRDNYMGVRNLLQLATKFEKLISLVHVSTFFSNSHLSHVDEKVLPMNRDCEKMAELISWIPDSLCETIAPQLMENRPNTYIFTKAMAENLVQKYQGRLPICIVRPSIVTPSVKDPEPGWVDNVNGPMGLGILASLGILRNIDWNYNGVADFIPVDMVVNCMLTVAERTTRLYPNEIKVYNCSTSSLCPVTWGQSFEVMRVEGFKSPPYKMIRIPIEVPKHNRANKIKFEMTKLSELLFAYFIDFILVLCGQKALLTKLTSKLHHGYEILKPFTTTEYTCSNENLIEAYEDLDPEDREKFNFNPKGLDWKKTFVDSYYGARKRLLKEDISNVPSAIFKMKILMLVEFLFKVLFYGIIVWNALKLYNHYREQAILSL